MIKAEDSSSLMDQTLALKPANVLGPRRLFQLFLRSLKQEMSNRSHRFMRDALLNLQISKPRKRPYARSSPTSLQHTDLNALNDWFDRIVVLTTERNEENRMVYVREELRGLQYETYVGVDQKDFHPTELRKMLQDFGCNPPADANPAMMAHSAGFIRLLREIVDRKIERTLFLEDDIVLNPYATSVFRQARAEIEGGLIQGNWDLIHFHSHLPCTPLDARLPGGSSQLYYPSIPEEIERDGLDWYDWVAVTMADPAKIIPFVKGRKYISDGAGWYLQCVFQAYYEHFSTLCLGISLTGAKKLLANAAVQWRASDRLCGSLSESLKHRSFIVSPFPCYPRPIASSFVY